MSRTPQDSLEEFFAVYGVERTTLENRAAVNARCSTLIAEEQVEVADAFSELSVAEPGSPEELAALAHLAKELADLEYVINYAALAHGIPLRRVFDIVHASNMNKVWPDGEIHRREDGKILKPPGYVGPEPEIETLLRESVAAPAPMP